MASLRRPGPTGGAGFKVAHVEAFNEALEYLQREPIDMVLVHGHGLARDALCTTEQLLESAPSTPVVLVIDASDDALAEAALSAGVQDVLIEPETDWRCLHRAIRNAVDRHSLLVLERRSREQAERAIRARDDVIAIVSHDLRAPLNAISMCARGLSDPGTDHAQLGNTILQSAQWTRRVIRDLLDVAAIDSKRLSIVRTPVTSCEVLEAVGVMFQPIARDSGVTLRVSAAASPGCVELDSDRMVQAIGNLVANAIRATPEGGEVTVHCATDEQCNLVFTVQDTGRGIPPAQLATLFDRFERPRERTRTTGLGLTIVKGIVDAHGGTVAVESQVGRGTTFTVVIPCACAPDTPLMPDFV